ncbi:hypothetical protein RR46_07474 [Papilio xuthus]|uniref:Uncharacterized protein n=1 Tax=Papilio xuthus TaxID=66420 RepID=A0A194Q6K4_PAPXU|nr:hypothetical protein RR46_07474 [Papilio xuthus]
MCENRFSIYGHRIECAGSIFACAVSRRFKIVRRVWCGVAAGRGVAAPDARGRLPPAAAAHAPCLRLAPSPCALRQPVTIALVGASHSRREIAPRTGVPALPNSLPAAN